MKRDRQAAIDRISEDMTRMSRDIKTIRRLLLETLKPDREDMIRKYLLLQREYEMVPVDNMLSVHLVSRYATPANLQRVEELNAEMSWIEEKFLFFYKMHIGDAITARAVSRYKEQLTAVTE